jgi:methylated-DNA-[protein]-cysteine S-methyltransferase
MPLVSSTINTPVGTLTLIASESHLRAVLWPLDGELQRVGIDGDDVDEGSNAITDLAGRQIIDHLAGDRHGFDLPTDAVGTDFQRTVWSALTDIAPGTTRTYAEHAAAIGRPEATRAVATAIGRNPLSIVVPCHRVIGADGSLTGFAGGLAAKARLLDHEARR